MQTLLGKHWHHLPAAEALVLLESDQEKGLDTFEIKHRQQHFGPNVLTPKKGKSPLLRFLLQFNNPLIYILLASSVITAVIKDPLDAAIIAAVVLINAIVGYVQEARAEQAIAALAEAMTTEATVLRSGLTLRIPAGELVPGDIVLLQAGNKVPADLRLLRARDLQVAEAALTGESVPVQKAVDVELAPETPLAERRNMAYASTLVTYGQGTGLVVATGDSTEIGRISQLISEAQELQTPLTRKIARFSRLVLVAILALAAVTFAIGLLRRQPVVETFTAAVALAVAAIPEGLPAALTVTLAIGVARMARRRAIIRKLPAVETLGSVTVICSDKTGTLTQNQMTVRQVLAGGRRYEVTGTGYAPIGNIHPWDMENAAPCRDLLPAQLPFAHPLDVPDRGPVQPLGPGRHRRDDRPAVALHLRPFHEQPGLQRPDRPGRLGARAGGGRRQLPGGRAGEIAAAATRVEGWKMKWTNNPSSLSPSPKEGACSTRWRLSYCPRPASCWPTCSSRNGSPDARRTMPRSCWGRR